MSWRSRIAGWLGKQGRSAPEAKLLIGKSSSPPPLGTQQFLESYDTNPWVRAAAGKVASSIGQTKWKLIRADRETEVRNHIALASLKRPNVLMSGSTLMRVTQLSLDLTGDSFWLLVRNWLQAPVQFWPLPPHWITDLPTSTKPSFKISWSGWRADIPEDNILWIHEASPGSPYGRGHGIIQALADEISSDEYASKHAGALFFNRAMPDVVVQDVGAGHDELKDHERVWKDKLGGLYKAMLPYFSNRKLEFWQPQQMNLENLTLVPLRQFERDIQLQCWGIPPEQFGLVESSNRATADASDYIYESRVVQPRRQFLADELTFKLIRQYDERLELTFIDTTPRDRELTQKLMQASPLSFFANEIRELAGYSPREDGQVSAVPMNQYVTTDLRDATQRPKNEPGAPKEEGKENGQ